MAYTVTKLITNAYYLSGVVSQSLETVEGPFIQQGLDLLNTLLSFVGVRGRLIPYFTLYDFNAVVGQEKYTIANLMHIETFTFFVNDVRFSSRNQSRDDYFGSPRTNNIQALPYRWHSERVKGGTDLYLYFEPDTAYPLQIMGKFSLSSVALTDDLESTYDLFYIEYLRYKLASKICSEFNVSFAPKSEMELKEIENSLVDVSPYDLSMEKASYFPSYTGINYGDINIGKGWRS